MKRCLLLILSIAGLPVALLAQTSHLDIRVPDRDSTDLTGPVKSVELDVCKNMSGDHSKELREYDRIGNLLKVSKWNHNEELTETATYFYDENGCFERRLYIYHEDERTNDWTVVLNPETRQIASKNERTGSVTLRTYSPEKYLLHYRKVDRNRRQISASRSKRNADNQQAEYIRFDGDNQAEYTYYFKWNENGFIDKERQSYRKEGGEWLHLYEYLGTDEQGNWTQRLMVRYNIGGKEREKLYEQTEVRRIEYFKAEPMETELASLADQAAETGPNAPPLTDIEMPELESIHALTEDATNKTEVVSIYKEGPGKLTEEEQKQKRLDELKDQFNYSFDDISYHLVTLKCESGGSEYYGCGFIAYMDEKPYLLTSQGTLFGADKIQFESAAYRTIKPHGIELSNERNIARMLLSQGEALALSDAASMSDVIAVSGSTMEGLEISHLGTITGVGADIIEVSADFTEELGGSPVFNTSGDVIGIASFVRKSSAHAMKKGTKFEDKTRRFCYRIDGIGWTSVNWKSFNQKYGMAHRQGNAFIDAVLIILNSWADDPFDPIRFQDAPDRTLSNWAESHNKVVGQGAGNDSFQRKYFANYSESTRKLAEVCRGKARHIRMLAEQRGLTEFLYSEYDMQAVTLETAAAIIDLYTTATDY